MSKTKFTKGDWELSIGDELELLMNGNTGMLINQYHQWVPSNVYDWHLIAAAPEMYEKLNEICEGMFEVGGADNVRVAREIENLLKKARGES